MKKLKTAVVLAVMLMASSVMAYDLHWIRATSGPEETGFRIYRKLPTETVFSELGTTGAGIMVFIDPVRIVGTCYMVKAFNDIGESAPAQACADVPGAVTVLVIQ